jgi:hypothetical protein
MACGSGMKAAMLGHGRYRCGGDVTLTRIRMHGRLLPWGLILCLGSGRSFPLCDRLHTVNAGLECGAL